MENKTYSAGFARLDMTPPLGVEIPGGWNRREGKGVLDPLYINAVAFWDGEKTAVLMVMDLLGMYEEMGNWNTRIAEVLRLSPEAVFLCATHSHTTPAVARPGSDELYDKWLFRRLCDAATLAINDCKPVTDVQWVEERAEGMTFVRRFYMKDGTVVTNPAGAAVEQIDRPASENDDTMRVIRILREEGEEIALVNFQSHPDNIGGELYSTDFPGALRDHVEELRADTKCVFLNGAEGQMVISNRMDLMGGKQREPASHAKATRYGRKLAEMAVDMFDRAVSTGKTGLCFGQTTIRLKTKRDPRRVPEAQRIVDLYNDERFEEIHPIRKIANYIKAESTQILRLEKLQQDYKPTAVSAITFCGMALLGIPGEPFNEVGKQVRANSKFAVTCICCQTNGSNGYFPMDFCYDQGGYESYNTPYIKGTAEQLVSAAKQLLDACR